MSTQNILTDMANNTARTQAENSKARMGQSAMDQDAFLQLLMAQIKNQDPMNPMDNSQMITQQAQFTTISELQKMNKNFQGSNQIMQASSLIGKEVTIQDPNDSKKTITGAVKEVTITSKGANIVINDKEYPMDSVQSIKEKI